LARQRARAAEHPVRLCHFPDALRALHNREQLVGRIAVHEGAWISVTKTQGGTHLVEAEPFDRGFVALSDYVNRASLNLGAGIVLRFVVVIQM
jgi:hypothetical protein